MQIKTSAKKGPAGTGPFFVIRLGTVDLVDGAAAGLTGIDVAAVFAAMGQTDVGEGLAIGHVVGVDGISEEVAELGLAGEDAGDSASGDIDDVVRDAAAVGEASGIASEQAHALAQVLGRGADADVDAE